MPQLDPNEFVMSTLVGLLEKSTTAIGFIVLVNTDGAVTGRKFIRQDLPRDPRQTMLSHAGACALSDLQRREHEALYNSIAAQLNALTQAAINSRKS
jgi:hypothetical protein